MDDAYLLPPFAAEFIRQLFDSKAAREGAVIRRKARTVDRVVGREPFVAEMKRRGYGVVENAGQYVIFCNREPLRRLA
ncbi:N-(5'-phosphoribosyl)anthranilate isomerase [Jannaschia sp. Os4]|uniref:N-(5'-phosphoribosyl)anthranilate isomerase n=1 Tax=Jannaschia sp. Os4 TaxID=2807617 RepID=UPI00193A7FA1|nr:N-(5'-phosphoribosyl)anthranilate isomerase [Jannaschia sp. Os4]MBM2577957.1 N-(5'-phosphoribosyl)anthranilate isomerase [Jannaschia sp. Os4]